MFCASVSSYKYIYSKYITTSYHFEKEKSDLSTDQYFVRISFLKTPIDLKLDGQGSDHNARSHLE